MALNLTTIGTRLCRAFRTGHPQRCCVHHVVRGVPIHPSQLGDDNVGELDDLGLDRRGIAREAGADQQLGAIERHVQLTTEGEVPGLIAHARHLDHIRKRRLLLARGDVVALVVHDADLGEEADVAGFGGGRDLVVAAAVVRLATPAATVPPKAAATSSVVTIEQGSFGAPSESAPVPGEAGSVVTAEAPIAGTGAATNPVDVDSESLEHAPSTPVPNYAIEAPRGCSHATSGCGRADGRFVGTGRTCRRVADGVDIVIRDGRIETIGIAPTTWSGPTLDGHGCLALPGLVDGHAHLDKTMSGLPWRPHNAEPGLAGLTPPNDLVDASSPRSLTAPEPCSMPTSTTEPLSCARTSMSTSTTA